MQYATKNLFKIESYSRSWLRGMQYAVQGKQNGSWWSWLCSTVHGFSVKTT